MAVTPVSEAGKQLLGTICKKQFISSLFLSSHAGIVKFFGHHLSLTWVKAGSEVGAKVLTG